MLGFYFSLLILVISPGYYWKSYHFTIVKYKTIQYKTLMSEEAMSVESMSEETTSEEYMSEETMSEESMSEEFEIKGKLVLYWFSRQALAKGSIWLIQYGPYCDLQILRFQPCSSISDYHFLFERNYEEYKKSKVPWLTEDMKQR